MTMNQIFGNFSEDILANKLFKIEFFLHSIPLIRRRQTRYLSIAFIGDYLSNLFPVHQEENIAFFEKQLEIKSAVTYITNELLENSMKFSYEQANYPIKLGICLLEKNLVFIASNGVNPKALNRLKNFIDELTNAEIDELYFRQLEKGAEEKSEESRLGFLSMMNDYSAKLGWKVETINTDPEITTITTMVQLAIELS